MRPPRVVAGAALIAVLASVAVTASTLSRTPSPDPTIDPGAFQPVGLDSLSGTAATTTNPNDAQVLPGRLPSGGAVYEPPMALATGAPPELAAGGNPTIPQARRITVVVDVWHHNPDESWYGPGFYGQHTACGEVLTETLRGVANRTLPCGTLVTFRNPNNGLTITVPVVDRGPYVSGRQWDLTKGACTVIDHCWTGPLDWRFP